LNLSSANSVTGLLPAANIDSAITRDTEWDTIAEIEAATGVTTIFTSSVKNDVLQGAQFAADAGANDTYTCTYSPAITAYVTGARYRFKANTANTGAATININSVGAKTIKKVVSGITTDLADNDIRAGQWVEMVYDGTNMQMVSMLGNAATGGGDSVQVNGSDATDANLKDGFQLEWFLNTTPNPDEITGRINPAAVITNATSIGREIYLGTATNVVIDPLNGNYTWAPAGNANCRFQFGTNTISATNYSPVIYIKIEGAAGQQWTNVVDTWTALGNVGVLKAGLNTIRASWDAGRWFFYQESAQQDASTIGDGTVSDAEYNRLDGVTSGIQGQIDGKVPTTRTITIAGTALQIVSSAGAQDLSANRTWTLSLDNTATLAGNPAFAANGLGFATTGLIFEGATADNFEGLLTPTDPTADRTWTLPDADTKIPIAAQLITFAGLTAGRTITLPDVNATVLSSASGEINALTSKATPTTSDLLVIEDAAASNAKKKVTVDAVLAANDARTKTLSNTRITPRITSITSSATPTVNTDNADCVTITALAAAITSMTTNLSGTPNNFDQLEFRIKDDGTARAITWGASFVAGPTALPTTTVVNKALHVYFEWDSVQSKWVCMSSGSDA
jgi:hypothetical protein